MKIMATKDLVVVSFCSSFIKIFFAFSGLKERRNEKKIITELAPKANAIGRIGLKDPIVAIGINIPKNIAVLWGQKPKEKTNPQAKEPSNVLLFNFLCGSCSQQCFLVNKFIEPKKIKRMPIIISPFSLNKEKSICDNPKNNIMVNKV